MLDDADVLDDSSCGVRKAELPCHTSQAGQLPHAPRVRGYQPSQIRRNLSFQRKWGRLQWVVNYYTKRNDRVKRSGEMCTSTTLLRVILQAYLKYLMVYAMMSSFRIVFHLDHIWKFIELRNN